MARLVAVAADRSATHTARERQANVTPFDIIINKSETPLKPGKFAARDASFG
jgi:hypothetical protein